MIRQATQSNPVFIPHSAFDAFLFTPIGEDQNGMPLTILSMFARMDIDPWQEAAALARASNDAAALRLSALIESLPETSSTRARPEAVSDLIALLPFRQGSRASSIINTLPATGTGTSYQTIIVYIVFVFITMAAMQLMQSHQSPSQSGAKELSQMTPAKKPGS
jgi:hypothetical protein